MTPSDPSPYETPPYDPGAEPASPMLPEIDPAGSPEEAPGQPSPSEDPIGRPYD